MMICANILSLLQKTQLFQFILNPFLPFTPPLFDITKEIVPFINADVSINNIVNENYCIEGDMIFADASEDIDDVGKSIEIINLNKEKLLAGLHTLLARQIKPKFAKGFAGYLFKADSIRNQIKREAQGAKVLGISAGRISNVKIYYPENTSEQQKMASCLSSLDELIAAHSSKLETLKDHKKGLMQNLFPQKGQKEPNYRFPEFEDDGEWVEEKLGDCLLQKPEYGMNAPAVPFSDSLSTYLRITDISEEGNFLSEGKVSVDREVTAIIICLRAI